MLIFNLPPVYLTLVIFIVFLIIFIYIRNIRRELSEATMQTVRPETGKKDVPAAEAEDELGLIMAVAAYYYQNKN